MYKLDMHMWSIVIGGGRGGAGGGALAPPPPPHFFADGTFFYMRTPGIPNQKLQADADMQPI